MQPWIPPTPISEFPPRSAFVTILAWLFIVGAGFSTLIAIVQALVVTFLLPQIHFWSNPASVGGLEKLPPLAQFFIGNMKAIFVASWALFVLTFIAAIALLRRKNWARLYFIWILALSIVWNIFALYLQYQFMDGLVQPNAKMSPEFAERFGTARVAMSTFGAAIAIGISVVLAWIVKRLLSKPIRAEFGAL